MQTHHTQFESKQEYAKYETLGEPHVEHVGASGFVEVVHKRERATLPDGRTRDFILIARGYTTRNGQRVTKSLVTLPAEVAPAVARVLAPGGVELGFDADAPAGASSAELRTASERALEA